MAVAILSRRNHSEWELRQKLIKRQFDAPDIELAIEYCFNYQWLDDQHVAKCMLRAAVAKGHGWQRICFDAKRKGITQALMDNAQQEQQHDWFELAKHLAIRRFAQADGTLAQTDKKTLAKRFHFLSYRGFSAEQIYYALNMHH